MTIRQRGFILTENGELIIKDTLEILDYSIDWTKRLVGFGGVIDTSVWTIPSGITQASPSPSIASPLTTIFLSGGSTVVGTKYRIVNKITTVAPNSRTLVQSFIIEMALG